MPEQKEINASFSCMCYGFEVKLLVNGIDVGVKGGLSESKRLFNSDHPMASQATAEIRAQRCGDWRMGTENYFVNFSGISGEKNPPFRIAGKATMRPITP